MSRERAWAFPLFLCFSLALFSPYLRGMGNYWDWMFPYFTSGWEKVFADTFSVWRESGQGEVISYHSWGLFQALVSGTGLVLQIRPEAYLIMLCSLLLAGAAHAAYLIIADKLKHPLAMLVSLVAVVNPAIYYKLLAGHLNYLASYAVFLYLVYFLKKQYDPQSPYAVVALGLLLAFVGIQIQFFAFALLVLLVYFVTFPEKFRITKVLGSLLICFLVNLPWLISYLGGVNSLGEASKSAAAAVFSGLSQADLTHMAVLAFSEATLIQYAYPKWMLAYFGCFTLFTIVLTLGYLLKKRGRASRDAAFYLYTLIPFVILGTGAFMSFPVPFLKTLYPMFREVGHFAPLIVVFQLLLAVAILKELAPAQRVVAGWCGYLGGFLILNACIFATSLPRVDFSNARQSFKEFNDLAASSSGTFRVATYPFWNQYGFKNQEDAYRRGRLLNNSGWDSFTEFSGFEYLSNNQSGGESIGDTLQYRLISAGDLDELKDLNVRYILDYSDIYESNFEKYAESGTYFNDLSLIKNDGSFLSDLQGSNPGLKKNSPKVLEIEEYLPRLFMAERNERASLYFRKVTPTEYAVEVKNLSEPLDVHFLESFHKDWRLYQVPAGSPLRDCLESKSQPYNFECQNGGGGGIVGGMRLAASGSPVVATHEVVKGYANKWSIGAEGLDKEKMTVNSDGSYDLSFRLYFVPQAYYLASLLVSILTILVSTALLFLRLNKRR